MRTRPGQEVGVTREGDIMSTTSIIMKEKITIGTSEEDIQVERKMTETAEEEWTPQLSQEAIDRSKMKTLLRFRQMTLLTQLVRRAKSKGIDGWRNHLV